MFFRISLKIALLSLTAAAHARSATAVAARAESTVSYVHETSARASTPENPIPPDYTELQWSICDSPEDFLEKTKLQPEDRQTHEVLFLETEQLLYWQNGTILKVKKNSNKKRITSSLKMNFVSLTDIPYELLNLPDLDCEVNLYRDQENIGCKIKHSSTFSESLWSEKQIQALRILKLPTAMQSLSEFGPLEYREWQIPNPHTVLGNNESITSKTTLDSLTAISPQREIKLFSEFSLRVATASAKFTYVQWLKYFEKQKVNLCKDQKPRAIQIFKHLREGET